MRAVVLTGHGGLERLQFREDWPLPQAGPGQVLVRVGACGLNNTDVNTRTAWYSAGGADATSGEAPPGAEDSDAAWSGRSISFPRVQGADVCGTVAAVGGEADSSLLGRRVLIDPWLRDWNAPHDRARCGYFGSECDGGFAEYTAAPVRNVHVVDSALSDPELASFPTSWLTAENMLNRAGVGPARPRAGDGRFGRRRFRAHPARRGDAGRGPSRSAQRTRRKPSGPRAPITCSPGPRPTFGWLSGTPPGGGR